MAEELKYKKILLKLSGEALAGNKPSGIDAEIVGRICEQIKVIKDLGVDLAIVVGGGNFWRGRYGETIERTTSDYMGMLATAINALAIQSELEARGMETRVQTAIEMREVAEPYIRRKAMNHLEKGRIVIFACGTGNPYFSTDTTAALRAAEIEADAILFAKTIDGVYSADPKKNPNAVKYDKLSYMEVLGKQLKVLDSTATSLCMDNNIPLVEFAMEGEKLISKGVPHADNVAPAILGGVVLLRSYEPLDIVRLPVPGKFCCTVAHPEIMEAQLWRVRCCRKRFPCTQPLLNGATLPDLLPDLQWETLTLWAAR